MCRPLELAKSKDRRKGDYSTMAGLPTVESLGPSYLAIVPVVPTQVANLDIA